MTRQEEINVLQSLKGDTYFAMKFGLDIDQMCENIRNDFPIENDCMFSKEASALKNDIKTIQKKSKEKIIDFAHKMLFALDKGNDTETMAYQSIKDVIGIEEIIKYKHANNIELYEDEISYLVDKLE
nr:MAG TPA: hypothetical protein [Caudoviricetes sp.]